MATATCTPRVRERLLLLLSIAACLLMPTTGCGEEFIALTGGTGATSLPGGSSGTAGTGGTNSTNSTSSEDTCNSSDADGDGYSVCDGDCDDSLDFVHPDALEICGDGIDGNCDGYTDADPPCSGIGTFVSQKAAMPNAKGTITDPFATISEGIAAAKTIGGHQVVFVAAAVYTEDVIISGKVALLGGFDPDDWSQRDPKVFSTVIENTTQEGTKIVGAAAPMFVSGFHIHGLPATGTVASSTAVTIDGGVALLSENVLIAAPVIAGPNSTTAVRVITEAATGGEVFIEGNIIETEASGGLAYGVHIASSTMNVSLQENSITARKGIESVALLISAAADVDVSENELQSGGATGTAEIPSASFGLWAKSGKIRFDSNVVNPDQLAESPKCFTPDVWCGGVRISTPDVTLTNNTIAGSASGNSAAVELLETGKSLATVVVNSNLFLASGSGGANTRSASVVLSSPKADTSTTLLGRFRNNIFFGGIASFNFGFYEQQLPAETVSVSALDHNLFFFPITEPNDPILYFDWNGVAPLVVTDLAFLPGAGDNLEGDPIFQDGHIGPASPCRNSGTEADAPPMDHERDTRPQEDKFDIGPDELVPPE
ncbi:MAG: putative metal-binding motif-containing protein [Polyangiaceae bacterium]|nr:putative metal-binding motif-containing protein [Polyangiaceae bacterium]